MTNQRLNRAVVDPAEWLDLAMVAGLCLLILLGFPVAFTLAGTALLFAGFGWLIGVFDPTFIGFLPSRIFGVMTNEILIVVPLFVFMGVMLERSKIAEELLDSMARLMLKVGGGLGMSVTIVGGLLAASTGIIGATVVTMGLLSLPTMLKHGYDPRLATGTIAASGTLGQIIPPSIVLVILGDQISNAHQEAARLSGDWTVQPVTVGDLFAGALLPGLVLVALYLLYQAITARIFPRSSPALPEETADISDPINQALRALAAPILLIIMVLGSILAGIATPTEAAGVGAAGAILLAGHRFELEKPFLIYSAGVSLVLLLVLNHLIDLRWGREQSSVIDQLGLAVALMLCALIAAGLWVALIRSYRNGTLAEVVQRTTRVSSMVFMIVIGAQLFSLVFRGFGGDARVHEFLSDMPGGAAGAMLAVMALLFVLGFFLDFIEITFLVVPIVGPILLQLGFDPIWLGVMIALNLQTSFLTPPFGLALFYLRGVAPSSITTGQIYVGIMPFVALQLIMLLLLASMPSMATWLPTAIYG